MMMDIGILGYWDIELYNVSSKCNTLVIFSASECFCEYSTNSELSRSEPMKTFPLLKLMAEFSVDRRLA